MRIMLAFSMQPERADALIKEGRMGETMGTILEEIRPEAAYFTDVDGTRGGYLIINMTGELPITRYVRPTKNIPSKRREHSSIGSRPYELRLVQNLKILRGFSAHLDNAEQCY